MNRTRFASLLLAILITLSIMMYIAPSSASRNEPDNGNRDDLLMFTARIIDISETSLEVESETYNGTVIARGEWFYISNSLGKASWSEAMDIIEPGEATILMKFYRRSNNTIPVLLGVKQEEIVIVREAFTRSSIVDHKNVRGFIEISGVLAKTGENYLILNKEGSNILFKITNDITWRVAGDGEATWNQLRDTFARGDHIQIYFKRLVRFNDLFTEFTGIRGVADGYGTIIDLTNGVTITT